MALKEMATALALGHTLQPGEVKGVCSAEAGGEPEDLGGALPQ